MEILLNYLKINHTRFRAVDGEMFFTNLTYLTSFENSKDIKLNLIKQNSYLTPDHGMGFGTMGCWLSYLFLMQELAKLNTSKPIVILEDDNDLDVDFRQLLNLSIQNVPNDWNLLLCDTCYKKLKESGRESSWPRIDEFACTNCFILRNSSSAQRIAKFLDIKTTTRPVDLALSDLTNKFVDFFLIQYLFRHIHKKKILPAKNITKFLFYHQIFQKVNVFFSTKLKRECSAYVIIGEVYPHH